MLELGGIKVVTIQQQPGFKNQLDKGIKKARESSCSILVSQIEQVQPIDPLAFFNSGKEIYNGQRIYWSDPTETLHLIGLGSVYTFESRQGHQFEMLEKEWNTITEDCVINEGLQPLGTGPLLLGGASFDPTKRNGQQWQAFPDSKMVLPEFLLTIYRGEAWLTKNVFIKPTDNPVEYENKYSDIQRQLIFGANNSHLKIVDYDVKLDEILKDEWMNIVKETAEEIRTEDKLEKVVLARELSVNSNYSFDHGSVLFNLKEEQPMSYIFAIESGEDCFLGASPERLVKRNGDQFYSTCLAGSIGRGKTLSEDEELGKKLLQDEKNLIEHNVVVQMIKSAFDEGCQYVMVPQKPALYKVRDIQHLYTPVIGTAKQGVSLLQMVKMLHPTPALGGNPRGFAMEKIREREHIDRGWYAAPIGWIDRNGNGEFAVGIRSGLIKGKSASIFAGCGIVADSDPQMEYKETQMKFKPMLSALGGKHNARQ